MSDSTYVLLQEGDADLRRVVAESLEQHGMQVSQATGEQNALAALQGEPPPEVLVVEFDHNGEATSRIIAGFRDATADNGKVVVTTDDRLDNGWRRSVQPDAVIYKPFDTRYLVHSIEELADDTRPNR